MNNNILLSGLFVLGAFVLSACGFTSVRGNGNVVSEERPVSGFERIDLSLSGDVYVVQGETESLKVEAEDNLMSYISTEVRGGTLYIASQPKSRIFMQATRPMRFYVTLKNVSGLNLSGSGSISSDKLSTGDIKLGISGSGNIDLKDLKAKDVDANVSGSGDVKINNLLADSFVADVSGSGDCFLEGEAPRQSLTVTGSGVCDTSKLNSKTVKVNVSGSGKTHVQASDTLDVNITGSGDVVYSGRPKVSQHVSGSGKIVSE